MSNFVNCCFIVLLNAFLFIGIHVKNLSFMIITSHRLYIISLCIQHSEVLHLSCAFPMQHTHTRTHTSDASLQTLFDQPFCRMLPLIHSPCSPPPGACRITSRPTASHCRAPCAARPRSCRRRVWRHCRTTSSSPTWWTCCSGRLTAAARRPPLSTTSPRWLQASCSPAPTMEAT